MISSAVTIEAHRKLAGIVDVESVDVGLRSGQEDGGGEYAYATCTVPFPRRRHSSLPPSSPLNLYFEALADKSIDDASAPPQYCRHSLVPLPCPILSHHPTTPPRITPPRRCARGNVTIHAPVSSCPGSASVTALHSLATNTGDSLRSLLHTGNTQAPPPRYVSIDKYRCIAPHDSLHPHPHAQAKAQPNILSTAERWLGRLTYEKSPMN